jgi:hypothetical protein
MLYSLAEILLNYLTIAYQPILKKNCNNFEESNIKAIQVLASKGYQDALQFDRDFVELFHHHLLLSQQKSRISTN